MEALVDLIALLVVMASASLVPILSIRNVLRNRFKPWRSAVQETSEIMARWAVWIAVVLMYAYSLWSTYDRWGPLSTAVWAMGAPLLLGGVAGGLMISKRSKR